MSLFEKLNQATSEEDVKDAYIKALGLKGYKKNLIDIQTVRENSLNEHIPWQALSLVTSMTSS